MSPSPSASRSPGPDPIAVAAVRGDAGAHDALVAAHGPRVYAMCARLAADPEDCYQEIWEKVLGAVSGFDPTGPAPIGAWIATIARRHLIDRHRRKQVRGQVVSIAGIAGTEPEVDEAIARHHRQARLEAAIRRLPDAQRRVVVHHHIHGVALEQLAEEEGVAVGTLKSRLHRGRVRLAELLGDDA
jgi:RNA polymerase sigma-70 factor, ECF subfamily